MMGERLLVIDKNERCPCGSGLTYKDCCKFRNDDESFYIDSFKDDVGRLNYETLRILRESKFRTCFHPCKAECSKDIKNAHTLQNNGILSLLAEDGHVMEVKHKVDMAEIDVSIVPQGKNRATTFTGFCGYHDTVLFKPIETIPYDKESLEQNFLYTYRIYALEHYKKLVSLIMFRKTIRKKPSILKDEFFVSYYRNQQLVEKDISSL